MNWSVKHAILFLGIINFLFVKPSLCQSLDEIVTFSDQQFDKGNFELAANEYNRALFFGYYAPDKLCLKIANCYFNQNKLEQSAQFFDRAYFSTKSDSIKNEAILGKSFALILEKNYMLALSELMNIDSAKIVYHDIKLNFLKGIALFGLHQDDLSEEYFTKCLRGLHVEDNPDIIEKNFKRIKKSERRFNPNTAWMLSLFLPGAGQIYSGNFREAANSSVLLGGLIYLTIAVARKYSYLEAVIAILPWFQRYYLGGANKAERLALERQNVERGKSYSAIMKFLESESEKNSSTHRL
jgi:hypothetical protein